MTVEQMREAISFVYAGPTWRYRVQAMDNRQVCAIYRSMLEEGRLVPQKKKQKPTGKVRKTEETEKYQEPICQQMTFWDLPEMKNEGESTNHE